MGRGGGALPSRKRGKKKKRGKSRPGQSSFPNEPRRTAAKSFLQHLGESRGRHRPHNGNKCLSTGDRGHLSENFSFERSFAVGILGNGPVGARGVFIRGKELQTINMKVPRRRGKERLSHGNGGKKRGGPLPLPPLPLPGFLKKQAAPAPSGSLAAGFHRGLFPSRCFAEEDTHNRRLLRLAKGGFCVGGRREVRPAAFQEAPRGGRFSGPEEGRNRRLQDLTARKSSGIFFAGGREAGATELPAKRLGGGIFIVRGPLAAAVGKNS